MPLDFTSLDAAVANLKLEAQAAADIQSAKAASDAQIATLTAQIVAAQADQTDAETKLVDLSTELQSISDILAASRAPVQVDPASVAAVEAVVT